MPKTLSRPGAKTPAQSLRSSVGQMLARDSDLRSAPQRSDPAAAKFQSPPLTDAIPPQGVMFRSDGFARGPASGLRVLGIAGDVGACGHFRVTYPLMALAGLGAAVEARVVTPDVALSADPFFRHDILLLQRQLDPTHLSAARALARVHGMLIVYDLDDYLHGVSPQSPAYVGFNRTTPLGRATLGMIEKFLTDSDGCLFSTRELSSWYSDPGAGFDRTARPHVILNGLDCALGHRDWDPDAPRVDWRPLARAQGCAPGPDSLLFGFSGGSTHGPDLEVLGDSVRQVLARVPDAFFGIQTASQMAYKFCVQKWNLPLHRVVYLPPVPFRDYPRGLTAFDVALCPLETTPFNFCKSNLRILELGAWGIPYVASDVAPFRRFHNESEGRGGFLARTPDEFARAVERLLTAAPERRARGEFLQGYVRTVYDVRLTASSLSYALRAIRVARDGVLQAPPLLTVADDASGHPAACRPDGPGAPCPCGSGTPYGACCAPAWGRV